MSRELRQETLAEIEEELRSGEYAPLADRIHSAWELEKSQSWHHREMEELILRHEKEVAELKKLIPQPDPDWKAICEKCHDGDIEPDCEYYGEPNGCNSPIYGEHPKTHHVVNESACREALEKIVNLLSSNVFVVIDANAAMVIGKCGKWAKDALARPPRNCDLARDWLQDLYCKFKPPATVRREMPPEWVDAVMAFCKWLLAPAEEGADDE